jgi:hypothetical protein
MSFFDRFRSPEKIAQIEAKKAVQLEAIRAEMALADWKYDFRIDELADTKALIGILKSTNSIELDFPYHGGSTMTIVVCRKPREVRFSIDHGQLIFKIETGYPEPKFVTRFNCRLNDGPVFTLKAFQPKSGVTNEAILVNPAEFTMGIRNRDKLVIEPDLYHSEKKVFNFRPRSMSHALY